MTKQKVTLTNSFHNTSVTVQGEITSNPKYSEDFIELSKGQANKIIRELCGMSDCGCGVQRGIGEWRFDHTHDGSKEIYFLARNKHDSDDE